MGSGDLEIVRRQLKRDIDNFRKVVKRCKWGFPVVIESLPEKEGKPFPTLYWLTCPHLRKEVAKLESKGWIRKFEEIIKKDEIFREKLVRAHLQVAKRREALIKNDKVREALRGVGSGGIRDLTKVKCLHLHLADFLAGVENPVGEMVWIMIDKRECDRIPSECE